MSNRHADCDPTPDLELLVRYRDESDQGAFERLVKRHSDLLFGIARKHVDSNDLEDVIQRCWLVVAFKCDQYDSSQSPFIAWLCGILNKELAKERACRARREVTLGCEILERADTGPEPSQQMEQAERVKDVMAAIDLLPQQQRLILLARLAGEDYDKIATLFAVTKENARQLVSRATRRLQEQFPDEATK